MNFEYKLQNKVYTDVANGLMTLISMNEDMKGDSIKGISEKELFESFNKFLPNQDLKLSSGDYSRTIEVLRINQVVVNRNNNSNLIFNYTFWYEYNDYLQKTSFEGDYLDNIMQKAYDQILDWQT